MQLNKSISISKLQTLLTNKAYNPYIDIINSDRVFVHLVEEIGELARAHRNKNPEDIKNECGDIIILLCFYAESKGINLEFAVFDKILENIEKGKFKPNQEIQLYE